MAKILTLLSLLIPAFSLLSRPHLLAMVLQPTTVRSPTTHALMHESIASVYSLRPDNFSAQTHSTSELLRTL